MSTARRGSDRDGPGRTEGGGAVPRARGATVTGRAAILRRLPPNLRARDCQLRRDSCALADPAGLANSGSGCPSARSTERATRPDCQCTDESVMIINHPNEVSLGRLTASAAGLRNVTVSANVKSQLWLNLKVRLPGVQVRTS